MNVQHKMYVKKCPNIPFINKDFLDVKNFFQESIPALHSNISQKLVTAKIKNKAPYPPVKPRTPKTTEN